MTRMIVLVSFLAVQLGAANSPCATAAPAAPSTTGWCDTPLCKGLVGAGAGVAGLAAIGGVAAAVAMKPTTTKKAAAAAPPPKKPLMAFVSTTGKKNFRLNEEEKGSDWLLPLLLGLLALCCILGIVGYFCMNKKKARNTKVSKKKAAPVPTETRDLEVAPASESAPLMGGHWEQPMQTVPVTTTTASYTPAVAAAPTYAMPTVVEPMYAAYATPAVAAAPTYAMPTVVEPMYAAYATAPTVVEAFAPTYATAPTTVLGTVAPTYAPTVGTSGYVV